MRQALLTELMARAPYQPATNYWRAVELEEVIRHGLPQGVGLDLGCGDGHLMEVILGSLGKRELYGLDVDAHETAMARRRGVYREVVTAGGDAIPFSAGRFDYVFSNSVLEHVRPIDATLSEVSRVLRPNGRFVFTVPGAEFHDCLRGPRGGERESYLREVDRRCAHLRYWSAADWDEHLRAAGLALEHRREYLSQAEVRRWERLALWTSGALYRLSGGRKQPIDIQRNLGIRSASVRLPRSVASFTASLLNLRVQCGAPRSGCLLLEARRMEQA